MKYFFLLFIAFNLISCVDSTETLTVEEENTTTDVAEKRTEELKIRNYSLREFPAIWWMLSIESEEMSIINHWDAQEMKFEITAETDSTGFIELTYAQDSDGGPLFDFTAELSEQSDSFSVIDGSFSFVGTLEKDTTKVKFKYDRLKQFAEFQGMYYSAETFVEDSLKDAFPYIETVREED